jgi:hypothetical protein
LTVGVLQGEVAVLAHGRGLNTLAGNVPAWHPGRNGEILPHPRLKDWIWDIVWDLIIEGVLRPGRNDGDGNERNLPFIHLTDFGAKRLDDPSTPLDPDGYLRVLRNKVPNADTVILSYVAESVRTFRIDCRLSSTITLGCASEKALLLLIEAYADALSSPAKFVEETKYGNIKRKYDALMKWFESGLKGRLLKSQNSDWVSEVEHALVSLFSYYRVVRNDTGHPTGTSISREEAYSHLIVFPHYLRKIYDLIEWLGQNKPIS